MQELTPKQVKVKEAADMLRFSTPTIRRLIRAGELTATGRGQLLRITVVSIDDYIKRNQHDKSQS